MLHYIAVLAAEDGSFVSEIEGWTRVVGTTIIGGGGVGIVVFLLRKLYAALKEGLQEDFQRVKKDNDAKTARITDLEAKVEKIEDDKDRWEGTYREMYWKYRQLVFEFTSRVPDGTSVLSTHNLLPGELLTSLPEAGPAATTVPAVAPAPLHIVESEGDHHV